MREDYKNIIYVLHRTFDLIASVYRIGYSQTVFCAKDSDEEDRFASLAALSQVPEWVYNTRKRRGVKERLAPASLRDFLSLR